LNTRPVAEEEGEGAGDDGEAGAQQQRAGHSLSDERHIGAEAQAVPGGGIGEPRDAEDQRDAERRQTNDDAMRESVYGKLNIVQWSILSHGGRRSELGARIAPRSDLQCVFPHKRAVFDPVDAETRRDGAVGASGAGEMGRSLNDVIAALPPEEQAAIDARYQELRQKVEGLRELRQLAGSDTTCVANSEYQCSQLSESSRCPLPLWC
jgi:hypothetical protein